MEDARIRGVGALLRMIQGPNDLVLAHTGLEKITLRIIVSYSHMIAVLNSDQSVLVARIRAY